MTNDVLDRFSPATAAWFRGSFSAPTTAQAGAWGVRVHDAAASVDALRTLDAVPAARGPRRG